MAFKPADIRQRREALGLTQGQLAEKLGVALNTVSRWENGASQPESFEMLDLALRQLEFEQDLSQNVEIQQRLELLSRTKRELEELIVRG
jgi:transcriptional regulator with XRE-family HTH domain